MLCTGQELRDYKRRADQEEDAEILRVIARLGGPPQDWTTKKYQTKETHETHAPPLYLPIHDTCLWRP
jgi:hypothetical protein